MEAACECLHLFPLSTPAPSPRALPLHIYIHAVHVYAGLCQVITCNFFPSAADMLLQAFPWILFPSSLS